MDDKELINLIEKDKSSGFKFLVNKYQRLVVNTCYGFVHNQADAEDIAQDVFIEVYRSIKRFRKQSKLSTWLYRIAVNKSLNHLRDNKKNTWLKSLDILFDDDSNTKTLEPEDSKNNMPDKITENKETGNYIYKAINTLPDNQKIAFTLNKYEDLSYKEIADVMELSLSSIESLIFRAKKNLQKKLIEHYKNL
ncbi:MAG: sigma-70 family RNA polymerase sigma factor [Bacteroidales bacterium]|nr:sigma-70 family RNA polymerase sigma factor [Bacteroidales bacterium]